MKGKIGVEFRVDEKGNKYPFVDVGSETHGRKSYRLWVSGRLVTEENGKHYLELPVLDAKIERTPKGSLVLRASNGWRVENIFVACGFRGYSEFEILEPQDVDVFGYKHYHSPRGNLGISNAALVNVPRAAVLKYRWKKSGRLYGAANEGINIIMPDGDERPFEDVPDGLNALAELKEVTENG